MDRNVLLPIICSLLLCLLGISSAHARIVVYDEGGKQVVFGGLIQVRYHIEDPDGGETTDELILRRFGPYIEATLYEEWMGKFQVDYGRGENDNELYVNDAFMRYQGFKQSQITIGNQKFPFSREFLSPEPRRQLIRVNFSGDRNFGTPDRNLGVNLTGDFASQRFTWGTQLAMAGIDQDENKLRFGTPANRESGFNEGPMLGGRIDWHPLGFMNFDQGSFDNETRLTLGLAAYSWANDGDSNPNTDPVTGTSTNITEPDVDNVSGLEISGAFNGSGLYVDGEFNLFTSDTVDPGFTGGIYVNGSTTMSNWFLRAGYMVMPETLDLILAFQLQDSDGYNKEWTRMTIGSNWYMAGRDIKLQFTYVAGQNLNGISGQDQNDLYLQAQYTF
jgi:hypothetical protein